MTAGAGGLAGSAFVLTLRPGMAAEYRRRHAAVWPEMLAALRAQGILRYEIYLCEATGQVFGFRLSDGRPPPAAEDAVILRWRAHMADVLEMEGERPRALPLERVFLMD